MKFGLALIVLTIGLVGIFFVVLASDRTLAAENHGMVAAESSAFAAGLVQVAQGLQRVSSPALAHPEPTQLLVLGFFLLFISTAVRVALARRRRRPRVSVPALCDRNSARRPAQ